jgi:GMP synthase-like glutamine amidotransferase
MHKPKRVHVLQHVAFEGLGSIATWLAAQQATVSHTYFFESNPSLPPVDAMDLLIILGGPMSVNDEEQLPWLKEEKRFIADAIAQDKAVLGICLGSQLIANAMDKRVYPGPQKEIGWFPVFGSAHDSDVFQFPPEVRVFHWHGETFDLPDQAVLLASSSICRNQAFQLGSRVLGFQFHLETTPESAIAILEHCADELDAPNGASNLEQSTIQSATELKSTPAAAYADINVLMEKALTFLMRNVR